MNKYLKIKYSHTCDIGGALFTVPNNAFSFVLYLPVDVGHNNYEIVDEGREDGEKNYISDFKKLEKNYTFTLVVPEYLYDAVCHIQLHNTINITTKFDENVRARNFAVTLDEWNVSNNENVAKITVTFTVDYEAVYGCCSANTYKPCRGCNSLIDITGLVSSTSQTFRNPIAAGVKPGTYYIVEGVNRYSIYYYRPVLDAKQPTGTWTYYEPKSSEEIICFGAYKFYYNGRFWQKYHVIKSLTDTGTQINVKGLTLPNTWVQVAVSTDGTNYTNFGAPISGALFYSAGVNVTGLTTGLTYYFKFNMYDNNCNYGFSNVLSVVKL